jgi:signal transduction histidine kinase
VRRRLVILSLATTVLIVISLIVPLGLLVRRQAEDRARVATERQAQSAAAFVALTVTLETSSQSIENAVGALSSGVIVVLADGTVFGGLLPGQGSLVEMALAEQATITAVVEGGWEVAIPVIASEGIAVVDAFATDAELTNGVTEAWLLLAFLGLLLVGLAIWVADRLGQRFVRPIRDLAGAAHLMSEGDLDTRVEIDSMQGVPPEIIEVGAAFNTLAVRLDQLLIEEREAAADLSHRLRTPLTSLRLQAEKIDNATDREETLVQVDRLEAAINRLIEISRSQKSAFPESCELDVVVADRASFWRVLAEEQKRDFDLDLDAGQCRLGVSAEDLGVVVDTLLGNVFAHTPPGTRFSIRTGESENRPWITVSDHGHGFADKSLVDRGVSGRGSTGLGLDIVRRTAELTGGHLDVNDRPGGGAVVHVWFG